MKIRSRAHEAGSIEAGSSISKSIVFANRVDGALVGQPNRASWGAQERTEHANRASKGARGGQIEPVVARLRRPGRARALGWSPWAPRAPSWAARRAISLWMIKFSSDQNTKWLKSFSVTSQVFGHTWTLLPLRQGSLPNHNQLQAETFYEEYGIHSQNFIAPNCHFFQK